jgi:hypothetical protein
LVSRARRGRRRFCAALGAIAVLAAGCAPVPPTGPTPPLPPGPTAAEIADFATAQMHYRYGLATGNDDLVAAASRTLAAVPREVFARADPRLFDAELVCERSSPRLTNPNRQLPPVPFAVRCEDVEWRYREATIAIRREIEAQIAAAQSATIAAAQPQRP